MTPIDLAGIGKELANVKQRAADAQAAFMALGGAAKGLKLEDVTKALKAVEAEEKRVALERQKAVTQALKAVEAEEKESTKRRSEEEKKRAAIINAAFAAPLRGAEILRSGFNVLGSTLGAVNAHVTNFVRLANPGAVLRFNLALADTQAVIGRALTPLLNQLTTVLRGVGNAIAGLDGGGQKLIASIVAGTIGLVAFGGAMLLVQTIATGGILPVITALVGAFGGAAFVMGSVGGVVEEIGAIFTGVFNKLGGVISQFTGSDAFGAMAVALAEVLGAIVDVGASIMAGLMPAFNSFAQLIQVFTPLITSAVGMFGTLLTTVVDVWAKGMVSMYETVTPYVLAFGKLTMDVFKGIYQTVQSLLAYIGVNLPDFGTGSAPRGTPGNSTGAAVRSTSTQDVSSVLQKAREASFSAGLGAKQDPASRTATGVESLNTKAEQIKDEITKMIRDIPGAIGRAVGDAVNRVIASAPDVANTVMDAASTPTGRVALAAISPAASLAMEGYRRAADLFD